MQLVLLSNGSHLLVRLKTGVSTVPGVPPHPEFDRLIEVYDIHGGRQIGEYLGVNGTGAERGTVCRARCGNEFRSRSKKLTILGL
jgi:hypothetical protein